jgi:hypothetical protein
VSEPSTWDLRESVPGIGRKGLLGRLIPVMASPGLSVLLPGTYFVLYVVQYSKTLFVLLFRDLPARHRPRHRP